MNLSTEKRHSTVLSMSEFYKCCEWFKKNRNELLTQRPRAKETANMVMSQLGIPISKATIPRIKEATGIMWKASKNGSSGSYQSRLKILTAIVINLCTNLDVKISDEELKTLIGNQADEK